MTPHPPSLDEFEISIFGPGKGECCLVHLGSGDWIVVDSCRSRTYGGNPALVYLDSIGVDVASQVRLVVATHAHDDHINGISEIVGRAVSAEFVIPSAASREEFFTLLEADIELGDLVRPRAYSEYQKVQEILDERTTGGVKAKMKLAAADRRLWQRVSDPAAEIWSLSPSDEAIVRAVQAFADLLVAEESERKRVASADPNTFAAALWVTAGDVTVLLGADLLTGPGALCGWTAVLNSTARPGGKASAYKVAHHGSHTSHHEGIWTDLLEADPLALLTPYRGSQSPPPTPDDIERIVGLAGDAYLSASTTVPQRDAVRRAASQLGSAASNVRAVDGLPGHIRARCSISGGPWVVECAKPAHRLG